MTLKLNIYYLFVTSNATHERGRENVKLRSSPVCVPELLTFSDYLTPERHEDGEDNCAGSVECRRRSPPVQAARVQHPYENAIVGVTPSGRAQDPVGHRRFRIANIAAKHVDEKKKKQTFIYILPIFIYFLLFFFRNNWYDFRIRSRVIGLECRVRGFRDDTTNNNTLVITLISHPREWAPSR